MAEFDNTNRGALFVNDKRSSDKAPDLKGKLNVGGKEYQISAWRKKSSSGADFYSLSIEEPYKKDGAAGANAANNSAQSRMDDEIPF